MKIAALIPTIYRPVGLRLSLSSLRATAPDVGAVVSGESDDVDARAICAEFGAGFVACLEPLQGPAYAWNAALKAAPDYDAYFTGSDDMEFTPGWLEEVLRVLDTQLHGSGCVGINDGRKQAKQPATHFFMTRDFIIQHHGGCICAPFMYNWTDIETHARAVRAKKYAYAEHALVRHMWNGPYGDEGYKRGEERVAKVKAGCNARAKAGWLNDFEPIIK